MHSAEGKQLTEAAIPLQVIACSQRLPAVSKSLDLCQVLLGQPPYKVAMLQNWELKNLDELFKNP